MLKLFLKIFFILAACILNGLHAKANHVYGADISCRYDSGSTYIVTVQAYQDCNSPFGPAGSISINLPNNLTTLSSSRCCAQDITPRSSSSCDLCSSSTCGFAFGIKKWTITAKVDLSKYSTCKFIFSYSDCCDLNSEVIYVESGLNRCHGDQTGPTYEENPITLLCVNSIFDRYQSAIPGNTHDSIRYYFTQPLASQGNDISFPAPYDYQYPITYTGTNPNASFGTGGYGFHYDSLTGRLQFKPSKVEYSYFATVSEEYKKDSSGKYYLFGTTMRRAMVNVISCNSNHPPVITGINGGKSDSIYVCANIPLKLYFQTFDYDNGDKVKLDAINETGGKISGSNTSWQTDTFTWTPTIADINTKPHFLTLIATDLGTPIPGESQRRFSFFVTDSFPATELSIVDSGCGKYHLGLTKPVDKGYKISYEWYVDSILVSKRSSYSFHTRMAGRHIIKLVLSKPGSCSRTYTDTLQYDMAYHKLPQTIGICKGSMVQLLAASGKNLVWTPSFGLSDSTIANPSAQPVSTTIYTISGTDTNGCAYTDQTKIVVSDFKLIKSPDQAICSGSDTKLYIKHVPNALSIWKTASGPDTAYGDTLYLRPFSNIKCYPILNLNGCIKTDSIDIKVIPTHFNLGADLFACQADTVILKTGNGSSYKWLALNHVNVILSTDSFYKFWASYTGIDKNFMVEIHNKTTGCLDTGYITVKVGVIKYALSAHTANICPGDATTFDVTGNYLYKWTENGNLVSSQNYLSVAPKNSTNYKLTIRDTVYGCVRQDSVSVYVSPVSTRYPTKLLCKGGFDTLKAQGGASYVWSPNNSLSNPYSENPVASPEITTNYTVAVTDAKSGCKRVDTVTVFVDKDCVWPGDANKDKTADYLDVLNIGVAYGAKGPARDTTTISWKRHAAFPWKDSLANGLNYKHIDCNGDGVVDARDTIAINANYGKSHPKWTLGTGNPSDPPIYFKFAKDTFYADDTAMAYLNLGTNTNPIKNIYGIGYQAIYFGLPLVVNTGNISPFCDYFCTGNEMNYLRTDYINNQIDAVTVETNGLTVSNTLGKIAVLKFRLMDSVKHNYPANGDKIYARLLSATAIDNTGTEINIYGLDDSAVVVKAPHKKSGIDPNKLKIGFKIYPNPANNTIVIETDQINVEKIILYNSLGQPVKEILNYNSSNSIDVSALKPGMYYIELNTNKSITREKILIER